MKATIHYFRCDGRGIVRSCISHEVEMDAARPLLASLNRRDCFVSRPGESPAVVVCELGDGHSLKVDGSEDVLSSLA